VQHNSTPSPFTPLPLVGKGGHTQDEKGERKSCEVDNKGGEGGRVKGGWEEGRARVALF